MNLTPEQRCAANCLAWWKAHGGLAPRITQAESDRVWFERSREMEEQIQRMVRSKQLVEAYAKNHGPSVIVGYREARTRTSAQIIIHIDRVEMDFDHWSPVDLAGLVGHLFEVSINRLGKRKTCPEKVAEALRRRGIHA